MSLTRPHKCDRFDCTNMVPEKRLKNAIRSKARVAYCTDSCRTVTQQRNHRGRKKEDAVAA